MEIAIHDFIEYLHNVKKTSYNTEISYKRDLKKLEEFLNEQGIPDEKQVNASLLNSYLIYLEKEQFAASSISRNVASVRAFFQFLWKSNRIPEDPSEGLHPPKVEKKLPEILTVEEVDTLLAQPNLKTVKGLRDKAMLELLYATGMRVSEMLHLKVSDINLNMGYVTCHERQKERIIPIGKVCQKAMKAYLSKAREKLIGGCKVEELFTNCSGKPMSRQGFWKVLKGYAQSAGITRDITSQTLRHSFAVHMLQNGADLKSVQEILGHSDISTTQVYLDMKVDNKMRDVYMKAHPRN